MNKNMFFMLSITLILVLLFTFYILLIPNNNFTQITASHHDGYLILVNKANPLESNFIPDKLVKVNNVDYIERKDETMYINEEVLYYYTLLVNESNNYDLNLTLFSGYRSYEKQQNLWKANPNERYLAKAGYSEHQTGLAIDVSTRNTGLTTNFMYTKEYKFLSNNAYKYGFIIRYPKEKEYLTGYSFEPWHLRYVGIKHSKYIFDNNLTLEEYLS